MFLILESLTIEGGVYPSSVHILGQLFVVRAKAATGSDDYPLRGLWGVSGGTVPSGGAIT